ncbi:Rrf2 family transcriptional regulator [Glutamicibacter sp. JL.03c]|uniref:RrF2 family transcriptional regulator n=1 Tax=Glutamicibacter sp. JL.03c TaxID=2984842 RepID=UPI0021F7D0DD|nr:Rrf2 family transcriptional regulator [Glutamicibacter sp. JL.03c]UYQ78060.1 Rrf2 family transcriptional regulator [Glutamicibacter sp. JL.03c]
MKLSAFADVCLRTLMVLGAPGVDQLTSREISGLVDVPYNHVTKAVLELRTLGILNVSRGRNGGAAMTAQGLETSLGALLRQLDKRDDVVDCTDIDGSGNCPLSGGCRLRSALRQAREAFYAALDPLTIREICSNSPAIAALPFPGLRRAAPSSASSE